MIRFLIGVVTGAVLLALGTYGYFRLGWLDVRGDRQPSGLEASLAMRFLDASLAHQAPQTKNPIEPTAANLTEGMKLYQGKCAGCHGDIANPKSGAVHSFSPAPPQFASEAPDMADHLNYFVVQHGIRFTGMPAWGGRLSSEELWQLTTFLGHMGKLPPEVEDAWRVAASEGREPAPPPKPASPPS